MDGDMQRRNQERMEYARSLIDKGHKCVFYMESYPVQIGWCNQNPCIKRKKTDDMKQSNQEA